jgi:hypothetical protein
MGHGIECDKCKKTYRYDSDEIEDTGTEWYPIWTVKCHGCGNQIDFEVYKDKFSENDWKIKEMPPRKSGRERAEKGDIREYWIQEYVKDNNVKLGFSKIEGPFDVGPDFKGVYKGKRVIVEAERDCQSFIQHKHHEDERFKEVSILIVLNPSEPPKEIKDKLPKTIIYINIDDFVEWWRPKARAYAKRKRTQNIIDRIASEFQNMVVEMRNAYCPYQDHDMATCPDCDVCPYFEGPGLLGEGEYDITEISDICHRMALEFIARYKYSITSDNFELADIHPFEIKKFFREHIQKYLR